MRPINDEEANLFHDIRNAPSEHIALVNTELNGKDVAVIVYVEDNQDTEEVDLIPLAVLMNDELFKTLSDPMKDGKQTIVTVEKLKDEWKKFTT